MLMHHVYNNKTPANISNLFIPVREANITILGFRQLVIFM